MKKRYRLLKQSGFQQLLRKGNRSFSPHFICYWRIDRLAENAQIGIIIPKKKCRLASRRKKYKRIFWAINHPHYLMFPKIKCVFFYKDSVFEQYENGDLSFISLREEYLDLMSHLIRKGR